MTRFCASTVIAVSLQVPDAQVAVVTVVSHVVLHLCLRFVPSVSTVKVSVHEGSVVKLVWVPALEAVPEVGETPHPDIV